MDSMRSSAFLAVMAVVGVSCGTSSPPGGSCSVPGGAPVGATCSNPVVSSTFAPPEQVLRLGQRVVGGSVPFEVPPNTASITIVLQSVNAPTSIRFQPPGGAARTLSNTAVPLQVTDPTGRVIYNDNPPVRVTDPNQIPLQPAFFASVAAGIGTFTIPNTSGGLQLSQPAGFPPGTWSLTVSDLAFKCTFEQAPGACCTGGSTSSLYDVMVINKRTPTGSIPNPGRLDVVVYFATSVAGGRPSAPPLSASTANAGLDPDLVRMQESLARILQNAGISLNSVRYVDLDPAIQARFASGVNIDDAGPCSELSQLFRSAAPGNALNIFFVRNFIASDLATTNEVVGVDGTIPGPSTLGGSVSSGAAVATLDLRRSGRSPPTTGPLLCPPDTIDPIRCGPDVTAYIIAHEAGHFLGLYHVTESEGTSFDPLLDTPMCPCLQCAPTSLRGQCANAAPAPPGTPHSMSVADCSPRPGFTSCDGGGNLMFWLLDQGSQGTVTPEQGLVMRANPLIQ